MEYADLIFETWEYMTEWLARFNDTVINTEFELVAEVMAFEN